MGTYLVANDHWGTPDYIWEKVKEVLGSDVFDPCPINPDFDGLNIHWKPKCFINPPYSRGNLSKWVTKAVMEGNRYQDQLDDSEWMIEPEFIWLINYGNSQNRRPIKHNAEALCDLYKRIAFIDPKTGKPKKGNARDQMIYYWGLNTDKFKQAFNSLGEIFING